MAELEPRFRDNQQNADMLLSSEPIVSAGAGTPTGPPSSVSASTQPQAQSPTQPLSPAPPTSNSVLYQPVNQQISQTGQGISTLSGQFKQQAGPQRTFEGIGAQQTLGQAVQPGADIQPAVDLASAEYTGPSTLSEVDPGQYRGLQTQVEQLKDYNQALRQPGGLQTYVSQRFGGLTPGESRHEAQRIRSSPEFPQFTQNVQSQVNRLWGQLSQARRGSEALATTRSQQEADIARQSLEQLQGQKGGIFETIDQEVQRRKAETATGRSAYDKWKETGDLSDLSAIPEAFRPDVQASDFMTPQRELAGEAQGEWDRLRGLPNVLRDEPEFYQVIDDSRFGNKNTRKGAQAFLDVTQGQEGGLPGATGPDLLQLAVSGHGGEKIKLSEEHRAGLEEAGMTKKGIKQYKNALEYYQKNILEPKFAPKTKRPSTFGTGPYEEVRPMYGDQLSTDQLKVQPFEPTDPRQYFTWNPGVLPSRGNVATEDQRSIVDNINKIIGESERLEDAGLPFQSAAVQANIEQFLKDDDAAWEAQKGTVNEAASQWRKKMSRIRKRYRRAKAKRDRDIAFSASTIHLSPYTQIPSLVEAIKDKPSVSQKEARTPEAKESRRKARKEEEQKRREEKQAKKKAKKYPAKYPA